jgi:hypothetical protein
MQRPFLQSTVSPFSQRTSPMKLILLRRMYQMLVRGDDDDGDDVNTRMETLKRNGLFCRNGIQRN